MVFGVDLLIDAYPSVSLALFNLDEVLPVQRLSLQRHAFFYSQEKNISDYIF
jgi:hypothetical protein